MTTIIKSLLSMAHRIVSPVYYRANSFEHCLFYDRADGRRVDFALVHIVIEYPSDILLHLASRKTKDNPNCNASEEIAFTMKETRLLRDFLNRAEVTAWINDDENEA